MKNYFVSYVYFDGNKNPTFGMTNFEEKNPISITILKEWKEVLTKKNTYSSFTPVITILNFQEIAKVESL